MRRKLCVGGFKIQFNYNTYCTYENSELGHVRVDVVKASRNLCLICSQVSDSKNVTETLCGFNSEAIPEAKDVVRIDLVGGFALQKVTSERSYFR